MKARSTLARWFLLAVTALAPACGGAAAPAPPAASPIAEAPAPVVSPPAAAPAPDEQAAAASPYPASRREDVVDDVHGAKVADPYRWLEDASNPEVQAWMKAQDALTRSKLDALPGRDELAARLNELMYYDSVSAPVRRGKRFFYTRRFKDREKAILYWRQGNGAERMIVDPNTLSADGSVALKGWWPSYDGRYLAYKLSRNNSDEATLYVRDLSTDKDLAETIADARFTEPSWTPDQRGFYYTWLPIDPSIPVADISGHAEVRFHRLRTDPVKDTIIHPATGDPTSSIGASVSRDGRYLFVSRSYGWAAADLWFKDLRGRARPVANPRNLPEAAGFTPLAVGVPAQFYPQAWRGKIYIRTNDGAPNFRLFEVDPKRPDRAAWREIVAEGETAMRGAEVIGNHHVLQFLRNATSELEVRTLDGKLVRKVALPGLGTVSQVVGNEDTDDAYYSYSSFTDVPQIFRTSIRGGKSTLWAKIDYPVDTTQLAVEQVWYPSKDGTKVSMFVVHRKDVPRDGSRQAVLYGYGGFNQTMTPAFGATFIPWLERGNVFALANLRGGGEYGEAWHQAGMLANKQNVFDDFIGAAEYLVAQKYTSPERLAIYGGSNGGLLVGAALTQRPDLFGAVICGVPLLDMMRYHLFGLGKAWIPEYGSADDVDQARTLLAYSPYHHVTKGTSYPALLMLSADSDDRVDPLHARKFVAMMQWAQGAADHPVLLRIERNAGHGGADMVKSTVAKTVDMYTFLAWQLGG